MHSPYYSINKSSQVQLHQGRAIHNERTAYMCLNLQYLGGLTRNVQSSVSSRLMTFLHHDSGNLHCKSMCCHQFDLTIEYRSSLSLIVIESSDSCCFELLPLFEFQVNTSLLILSAAWSELTCSLVLMSSLL